MKKTISLFLCLIMIFVAGCGESGQVVPDDGGYAVPQSTEASEAVPAKARKGVSEDAGPTSASGAAVSGDEAASGTGGRFRLVNTYFDQSRHTDSGNYTYFQCFGNHILCSIETETAYPKLARALREIADEEEKDFKAEVKEYDREAFEYEESLRSSGNTGCYYHYADDALKRADEKCVSLVRISNGYLGGAHPDFYYETWNIDPSTGKEILLSDVISSQEKLNEILEQKLLADYPDVEYFGLKDSLAEYDMSLKESEEKDDGDFLYAYEFTLDPDGISFYFSPYGVSAYAYGDQVVKILYDEEPSLMKKDYSCGGEYISYLTDADNKYGLGGTAEKLNVERSDYDENDMFRQIDVYKGDKLLSITDTDCYNLKAFTAHTDSGKDFAYIIANIEDDYKSFFAADLTGTVPTEVELDKDMILCYSDYYDEASGIYGVVLPLYPDDMELAVRCDLLSTYNASGHYEILDSGKLKLKDKYFMIREGVFVLTSKADLTADIVDEDGNVKEKDVTIEKGSEFSLYRTDGVGIVDAKLSDGRIVRLNVSTDYPHMINGTYNEESLFDGLMYAG